MITLLSAAVFAYLEAIGIKVVTDWGMMYIAWVVEILCEIGCFLFMLGIKKIKK